MVFIPARRGTTPASRLHDNVNQRWRRTLTVVGLLATSLLHALLGTSFALAQSTGTGTQTWEVQVSGIDPDLRSTFTAQGFFPGPLVIRAGDTVTWRWAMGSGNHTVTFNAGQPSPGVIVPGPNAGEFQIGPVFFPMGPVGPGATFDGTVQTSSGVPRDPTATYSLTFPTAGVFGYVCAIHPAMRSEVVVREAGAMLQESPDEAKTRGQVTLGAVLDRMKAEAAAARPASALGVHAALAGLSGGFGASYEQFAPTNLTVRRGDVVVWTMPDPSEIHTVTFLSGAASPEFVQPRPQPSGPPALIVSQAAIAPSGGNSYTGQGIVNSGILNNGSSFVLRFDAPPGSYEYVCLVHPPMKATVTVTG